MASESRDEEEVLVVPESRGREEVLNTVEREEELEQALDLEDYEDLGIPEPQMEEPQGKLAPPRMPHVHHDHQ